MPVYFFASVHALWWIPEYWKEEHPKDIPHFVVRNCCHLCCAGRKILSLTPEIDKTVFHSSNAMTAWVVWLTCLVKWNSVDDIIVFCCFGWTEVQIFGACWLHIHCPLTFFSLLHCAVAMSFDMTNFLTVLWWCCNSSAAGLTVTRWMKQVMFYVSRLNACKLFPSECM